MRGMLCWFEQPRLIHGKNDPGNCRDGSRQAWTDLIDLLMRLMAASIRGCMQDSTLVVGCTLQLDPFRLLTRRYETFQYAHMRNLVG